MAGRPPTSTLGVTTRGPLSLYSRSKTETASEATPRLSGHLLLIASGLVTVMRCCLTSLAAVTSQTKKQDTGYTAIERGDLVFLVMIIVSYQQTLNHLMVMETAGHMQINLVILSQLMLMVIICSLTKRMDYSQSAS